MRIYDSFKSRVKQSIFKDDEMVNEFIFKDCKDSIVEKVYNFYKGRAKVKYKKGFIKRPRLQIELKFDNEQVFKRVTSLQKKHARIDRTFEEELIKGLTDMIPSNVDLEFVGYATSSSDPITAKVRFTDYTAQAIVKQNIVRKAANDSIDPSGKIIIKVVFQTNYIQPVETKRDLKFEEKVAWAVDEAKDSYGAILYDLFHPIENNDGEKCLLYEIGENQYEANLKFNTSQSVINNIICNKSNEYMTQGKQLDEDIILEIFKQTADNEICNHNFNYFYNIVGNEVKGSFNLIAKTIVRNFNVELIESDNNDDPNYQISCEYVITVDKK